MRAGKTKEATKRWIVTAALALLALIAARTAQADGDTCLTREQAITLIAHKADVEYGGRVSKWRVWQIAERESGLQHCDITGRVRVSATGDHGLLQLNPLGVWANCLVNRYCRAPWMMDDPAAQVDVMLAYAARYGDLCPWNPDGDYLPGCGYR